MEKIKIHVQESGFLLVEILVAVSVIGIVLGAAVGSLGTSQELVHIGRSKTEALGHVAEYYEYVKNIKRFDWDLLANGRYVLVQSGNDVVPQTTVTGETVNGYTRYLDITNVYRDDAGDIVSSLGTVDPSTKLITITISWSGIKPGTFTVPVYVTRYLDNLAWVQTTENDFDAGTHSSTVAINTAGGEVILGAGGHGDWCRPDNYIIAQHDLPQGAAARRLNAIEGKAFTGTNQSGTGNFVELAITNDDTPLISTSSSISGYETRDVFVDGNYAYVATANTSRDVVIIDLTTNTEVGYFNDPDFFGSSQGVFVRGNVGYAVIGPRLHTFDLTQKTGSRPQLDSERLRPGVLLWLFVQGYRLQVVGDYAYIALSGWTSAEMRLINVSNPSNLAIGAYANITNGHNGREVAVNETGTRVYLATVQSGSENEFFIINTGVSAANKNNANYSLPVISSYNSQGMDPWGLSIVPGGRALLVGTGAEEYQAINITNENAPVRCGGVQVNSGIYGIDVVLESDGDAYSYIVTGDPNDEFKIIRGGPGGVYASSGVFESETLDTGNTSAFNRFDVHHSVPIQTNITYQVGILDAGGGSCNSVTFTDFSFVGPDGTSATFFSDGDSIPLDDDGLNFENPGQCFRYRVYLTSSDAYTTPQFEDITVNYSP